MPRPQNPAFRIYVLLVCTTWFAVLIAVLWGLDWRWIPTTFIAAAIALLIGGLVENHLHERAEKRALLAAFDEAKGKPGWWLPRTDEEREARSAAIAAEEDAWLGGTEQQR
jgi:hypothetical protein